jgi:hypothetical protein
MSEKFEFREIYKSMLSENCPKVYSTIGYCDGRFCFEVKHKDVLGEEHVIYLGISEVEKMYETLQADKFYEHIKEVEA